jgi:hypothetical protein
VTHINLETGYWLRGQVEAAVNGMDKRTRTMPPVGPLR